MTTPDDPRGRDEPPTDPRAEDDDAEDRAAILRRRAVFIASAIAGLGMSACSGDPRPCLDVAIPPETTADPGPCLTMAPEPSTTTSSPDPLDAGTGQDADAGDGGEPRPEPRPCLKVAPPRPCLSPPVPSTSPPRPCLDIAPPADPTDPNR